jgi:hypothetical protein
MSGERQIELTWRCTTCGHRNLGRHVVCTNCGNPKDASEQDEMPADPSAVASVADPEMLRMATAGAHWKCPFCGSNQRAYDGSCGHCGAGKPPMAASPDQPPRAAAPVAKPRRSMPVALLLAAGAAGLLGFGTCAGVVAWRGAHRGAGQAPRPVGHLLPRVVEGRVAKVEWRHTLVVERWQLFDREGFEEGRPADAVEVKAKEKRVHHTEKVQDGFDTEWYEERVQDGTTRESYTERVSCGQNCTTAPRTCREVCTKNKNGFATCRQECTGGNQSCTTKYCDETKYRDVPRYKNVRRSRQKPRYRDEPRYATWYSWRVWGWGEVRRLPLSGTTTDTAWPTDAETEATARSGKPDKLRARRDAFYGVTFQYAGDRAHAHSPSSEQDFKRFAPGTAFGLVTCRDDVLAVVGAASARAAAAD